MTKHELAHLVLTPEELKNMDYALPDPFVADCQNLNIDPRPFFIWCHLDSVFGYPINLAERFHMIYKHAQKLWDNTQAMIIDAQDRGEHLDDDGKMHDDHLQVCHALDAITLDKREVFGEKIKTETAYRNMYDQYQSHEKKSESIMRGILKM